MRGNIINFNLKQASKTITPVASDGLNTAWKKWWRCITSQAMAIKVRYQKKTRYHQHHHCHCTWNYIKKVWTEFTKNSIHESLWFQSVNSYTKIGCIKRNMETKKLCKWSNKLETRCKEQCKVYWMSVEWLRIKQKQGRMNRWKKHIERLVWWTRVMGAWQQIVCVMVK